MASPRYRAGGSAHVLLNRSRSGDRILLEDLSTWRIDPSGAARARLWPQWTKVRVQPAIGNAHWLIAEVLGQKESVLAVFVGALPHATAPVVREASVAATSEPKI